MPNFISLYVETLGKLPVMALILLAAISVITGDYSAKAWSVNHKTEFLLLAFAGYFFSGFFYIPTLLREGLIITSVVWGIISTVGFLVIGFVIFKEHLTPIQIISVVLGIASILLFTFSE